MDGINGVQIGPGATPFRWIRSLLQHLASEGRTIFLSSHLMSEMEETADHIIVIGRGRLIADTSIAGFTQRSASSHVRVVSPQAAELAPLLRSTDAIVVNDADALIVTSMETPQIGYIAAAHHIEIHELAVRRASLEDAFMDLTEDSVQYHQVAPKEAAILETALAGSGKATR